MDRSEPPFTLVIEEEYPPVDLDSRNVATDPPPDIFDECQSQAGDSLVEHELLRSQIEVVDWLVAETVRDT